jgi:hypothetical protein
MLRGFDTNQRITAPIAAALAASGYQFACRYLRRSPNDQSLLKRAEANILAGAGLRIASVFQHRSNRPDLFTVENARLDAEAALRRALELLQPRHSAIYFACDCDFTPKTIRFALAYFEVVRRIVSDAGLAYGVGVYGDDLVLSEVCGRDLADHAWLTNAKGWLDDRAFDDWDIKQTSLPHAPLPAAPSFEIDDDEAVGVEVAGLWQAR